MMALFLCVIPAYTAKAQDVIPIPVLPGHNGGDTPRSPELAPVQCLLIDGDLYFSFVSDLGNVTITVSESILGVVQQTIVDSSMLSAIIPFPTGPGYYTITITLSSGAVYYGQINVFFTSL